MEQFKLNQLIKLALLTLIIIPLTNSCQSSSSKEINYSFKIIRDTDTEYNNTILVVLNKDNSIRMYDDKIDYSYDEDFIRNSYYANTIYNLIMESDGSGNYKYANTLFGSPKKIYRKKYSVIKSKFTNPQIDSLNKYIHLAFKLPIQGAEQSNNPILKKINKIYYDVEKYKDINQKEKKYGFQTFFLNNDGEIEYRNSIFGGVVEENPEIIFKRGYSGETVIDNRM